MIATSHKGLDWRNYCNKRYFKTKSFLSPILLQFCFPVYCALIVLHFGFIFLFTVSRNFWLSTKPLTIIVTLQIKIPIISTYQKRKANKIRWNTKTFSALFRVTPVVFLLSPTTIVPAINLIEVPYASVNKTGHSNLPEPFRVAHLQLSFCRYGGSFFSWRKNPVGTGVSQVYS